MYSLFTKKKFHFVIACYSHLSIRYTYTSYVYYMSNEFCCDEWLKNKTYMCIYTYWN